MEGIEQTIGSFQERGRKLLNSLEQRSVRLDKLIQVEEFLVEAEEFSSQPLYRRLCEKYAAHWDRILDPLRHRMRLEGIKDPGQLLRIRGQFEKWLTSITMIKPLFEIVPDWRIAHYKALHHIVYALYLRQRQASHNLIEVQWREAADIFGRWLNDHDDLRDSYEYKLTEANYYLCCSRAERFLGQSCLNRHPHTAGHFDTIVRTFESAHLSMQQSADKMQEIGEHFTPQELDQLDYFIEMCKIRKALDTLDFDKALALLPGAKKHAVDGRFPILPYYENIPNLENDHNFIESFRALANNDIQKARESMKTWFDNKSVVEGNPRWKLMRIRQLALGILAGEEEAIEELKAILKVPPYLASSQFIGDACEAMVKGIISKEQALENLIKVFPIDAFPPEEYQDKRRPISVDELLLFLPGVYSDWLYNQLPTTERAKQLCYLCFNYIKIITECLCGIYNVKLNRGEISEHIPIPHDFTLLPLAEIQELLNTLHNAMQWTGTEILQLISYIEQVHPKISYLEEEPTNTEVDELKELLLDMIKSTARELFPCIVKVQGQTELPDGLVSILLKREWCFPDKHFELICFERKDLQPGEWYYLKPPFKQKVGLRYDEKVIGICNFYPTSTFEFPQMGSFMLLVEGKHDAAAIHNLLNHFVPYWKAQIELHYGEGSDVPKEHEKAIEIGYTVVTISDGDKRDIWKWHDIYFLDPDFEGLDDRALSAAVNEGWGESGIHISEEEVKFAKTLPRGRGGTVEQLGQYLKDKIGVLSWDVGEVKERLAELIPKHWITENRLPDAVKAPIFRMLELAFNRLESGEG